MNILAEEGITYHIISSYHIVDKHTWYVYEKKLSFQKNTTITRLSQT